MKLSMQAIRCTLNQLIFTAVIVITPLCGSTAPQIGGYLFSGVSCNPAEKESQFEIKFARVNLKGNVNETIRYKLMIDLARMNTLVKNISDSNSIITRYKPTPILLDAQLDYSPRLDYTLSAGRMKIPVSASNLQNPFELEFFQRPLIRKFIPDTRGTGVLSRLEPFQQKPFKLHMGLFNSPNAYDDESHLDGVLYTNYNPGNMKFSMSFLQGFIDTVQNQITDLAVSVKFDHIHIESEYMIQKLQQHPEALTRDGWFLNFVRPYAFQNLQGVELRAAIRMEQTYTRHGPQQERLIIGLTVIFDSSHNNWLRLNYESSKNQDPHSTEESIAVMWMVRL